MVLNMGLGADEAPVLSAIMRVAHIAMSARKNILAIEETKISPSSVGAIYGFMYLKASAVLSLYILTRCDFDWKTQVHTAWPSIIEVVNITSEHGGPENLNFSRVLSSEAVRKWEEFINERPGSVDDLNDRFFKYQSAVYERHHGKRSSRGAFRDPHVNVTWPELEVLPEYQRLRNYISSFGARYLARVGYTGPPFLNIFSWAAIHTHADFHGPHTHTGELLVGVYYARVNKGSGRLRLFDPRGQVVPFGRTFDFDCQEGQMIFFPSWLQHEALPTKSEDNEHRVIFAFNIGVGGVGEFSSMEWGLDPVSGFITSATYEVEEPLKEKLGLRMSEAKCDNFEHEL
jgi:hypothetical protein